MSMDDFFPAAQSISAWLAPFLPYLIKGAKLAGEEWFKKLGEEGGKEAVKQATEMWDSLKNSSKDNKKVEGTALLLSEDPNNEDFQKLFCDSITEVLQKNPGLAQELTSYVNITHTVNINRQNGVFSSSEGNLTGEGDVVRGNQTKGISGQDLNQIVETLLKHFPKSYLQNPNELDKTLDDLRDIVGTLRKHFPESHLQNPNELDQTLKDLHHYHKLLREYKELHNKINKILVDFDQFRAEVRRLKSIGNTTELEPLRTRWQPVSLGVEQLLDWSQNIKYIGEPFKNLGKEGKRGAKWAVDFSEAYDAINQGLMTSSRRNKNLRLSALDNCTDQFNHITLNHMSMTDYKLLETAEELLNISNRALSNH